jgi:hypothetical protein
MTLRVDTTAQHPATAWPLAATGCQADFTPLCQRQLGKHLAVITLEQLVEAAIMQCQAQAFSSACANWGRCGLTKKYMAVG